ncbi:MAG: zinc-dependent peptidase, partial [Planctomycetota bacterium]
MKGSWLHPIRTWRRRRATASPFPEAWTEVLEDRLPIYARLPTEDQTELRRKIQIFLSEKRLEGAGGQEINDEVRVLIAAQACLLLLHRGDDID